MISRILDRLYVGDSSWTPTRLREIGVWKVVNVGGVPKQYDNIYSLHLTDDGENPPSALSTVLSEVADGVAKGPVLVCCRAGVSRSPLVAVLWLQRMGMSRLEAYAYVKERAPATQINPDLLESA